jgi:hypothetical protein
MYAHTHAHARANTHAHTDATLRFVMARQSLRFDPARSGGVVRHSASLVVHREPVRWQVVCASLRPQLAHHRTRPAPLWLSAPIRGTHASTQAYARARSTVHQCMAQTHHGRRHRNCSTVAPRVPGPGSPLPHLHRDRAHPCHICTGTGLTPAHIWAGTGLALPTSAPGLSSPLPHLHRNWAHPCHICTGTGLTPATSAQELGSPLPHLHRDRARPCHICTGTGLTPATSAPGPGSRLPHLHRNWAHPCHICTGTGLAPATSAQELGSPPLTSGPELGSPLPHLHRNWAHPRSHLGRDRARPAHICTRTELPLLPRVPHLAAWRRL